MDTYRGRNVRQVVFVSWSCDLIVPAAAGIPVPSIIRKSVERHEAHPPGQVRVVRHGHAALTSRHGLVGIKRKAAHRGSSFAAPLPGLFLTAPPGGRKSMDSVFNDPQAVDLGKVLKGRTVDHHPSYVHWDYAHHRRVRPNRKWQLARSKLLNLPVGILKIDIQSLNVTVNQHWNCSLIPEYLCGGRKRHRGHEDTLTLP